NHNAPPREISIEVSKLIAAIPHRWPEIITESVVQCDFGCHTPAILNKKRKMIGVRASVRRVLGIAGCHGQAKEEVGKSVTAEASVESVAAILFAVEKRHLVLVLHSLIIGSSLD